MPLTRIKAFLFGAIFAVVAAALGGLLMRRPYRRPRAWPSLETRVPGDEAALARPRLFAGTRNPGGDGDPAERT